MISSRLKQLFLLASGVSAAQNVVYWGQNGNGAAENNDLSTYCNSTAGIDILVLSFLSHYGPSETVPSGAFGQHCLVQSGEGKYCEAVASAIAECQSVGVNVILALGGAKGAYSLSGYEQAEEMGQYLWDAYGNSNSTTVYRPFGGVYVNGFDFDIERNNDGDSQYYPAMISTLRSNFASDPNNTYYITGAPQCLLPEPNMGDIIANATFDYLFIQWYNNDLCALPFTGIASFNYDDWINYTASTLSKDAEIFIGVPASPLAANGTDSGEVYYITPAQLSQVVDDYRGAERFGGIMMWNTGYSDSNAKDTTGGCTYAQEAHAVLAHGGPCSEGPSTSAQTTSSLPTRTATWATPAKATGTVEDWQQCAGLGYGPGLGVCATTGAVCVEISEWWWQCVPPEEPTSTPVSSLAQNATMPPSKQVAGPGLGIVINNNLGRPYQPGDIITGRVVREAHVVSPMAVVEVWLLGRAKVKLGVESTSSNGSSTTTYYRGRFNFFDKTPQRIQAGPVHVPPNGPAESWPFAIEIPSTMSPKSVLTEYKDHKDFSSGSFVPLDAQTIQAQSLPSSFTAMGYNVGTKFECYVEYHVEASLVLQGRHGKVISASQPIGVHAKPMSYPPASFEFLQRRLYVSEVNTFRLVPGMQEAHLSFKQKTQKLFHSSKVPSLGLNIYMDTPTNIQLGNPLPVPLRIQIIPDRKRTSEVLHDAPQTALITSMELTLKAKTFVLANGYKKTYDTNGTAKHRILLPCLTTTSALLVDDAKGNDRSPPTYQEKGSAGPPHLDTKQRLPTPPRYERAAIENTEGKLGAPTSSTAELRISPGESSASGSQSNPVVIPGPVSKRSGLRLPINWGPNAFNPTLDIGTLMELRFFPDRIQILGNRCAETACRQAPGGVFPDFTTFCIKHEHALKWKVWLEIAGEVVALEGENPVSVQGPAAS